MTDTATTVEAPERGLPPDAGIEPLAAVRHRCHVPRAGARAARCLDRLPDALDDPAELLRPERRQLHRDRQLPDAVRATRRSGRRSRTTSSGCSSCRCSSRRSVSSSRCRSADPLLRRVQGRRLHADGDLALRRRRDLAADVREDPAQGTVNASIAVVKDAVQPSGRCPPRCPRATPSRAAPIRAWFQHAAAHGRRRADRGLTSIRELDMRRCPASGGAGARSRHHRRRLERLHARWRTPGKVDDGELGLPNQEELRDDSGGRVQSSTTQPNGTFEFLQRCRGGTYRAAIASDTFAQPFAGVSWLGESLAITPAAMRTAYIWVWAGFAMP